MAQRIIQEGDERERFAQAFGRIIGDRRVELGLTLREVARRAGMDDAQLSRMESGKTVPRADTFVRLLTVLDLQDASLYELLPFVWDRSELFPRLRLLDDPTNGNGNASDKMKGAKRTSPKQAA